MVTFFNDIQSVFSASLGLLSKIYVRCLSWHSHYQGNSFGLSADYYSVVFSL